MVERIKSHISQVTEDLIEETKSFRIKEDKIFEDVKALVLNCCLTDEGKDLVEFNKRKFLEEIDKLKNIKRYNSYVKGNPENGWDFFEMGDFILFLREKYPDTIKNLLKEYKGGKYNF